MATAPKKRGFDIDDVPDSNGGNQRKPADMVDLYALPEKKYVKLRFFGDIFAYGGHWIKTKKKDGKEGNFFHTCSAFDTETGKLDSTKHCAFCDDDSGLVRFTIDYFVNAISRKDQQNAPERIKATAAETESGFKSKESESYTPCKAVRLTNSVLRRLKELRQLNVHENAEGESMNYSVMHPKYGVDLSIKKDKDLPPANQYDVQIGTHSPLKKEERAYLIWDLSELMITPTAEAVSLEYKKWATRMGFSAKKSDAAEDEAEDDAPKAKKTTKPRADDFDEDEEPAPTKKKVVKPAADDFDDEDETPPPKKKKVVEDEDEDEDEDAPVKKPVKKKVVADDFDADEDDETPPPKKKKVVVEEDDEDEEPVKKPVKKKPAADDFDDEDETPPPKKKKPVVEDEEDEEPVRKPVKKKVVVEDDEDDETPPPKKTVKKKPAVEDDDFDE